MREARPIDIVKRLRFKKDDTGLLLEYPTTHNHSRLSWKDRFKLFLGGSVVLNDSVEFKDMDEVRKKLKVYIISG